MRLEEILRKLIDLVKYYRKALWETREHSFSDDQLKRLNRLLKECVEADLVDIK